MLHKSDPDQTANIIDLDMAERFLKRLDPDAAFFTFQTFDDNQDRKSKSLVRVLHGTLAHDASALKRLNDNGAGIFVTINGTNHRGRKAKNIVRIRALWVDLDGAPLDPVLNDQELPKPHLVIESSPGRWHPYWFVTGIALQDFTALQKALIARFHSDPSVHDLSRVMRLPGFWHRKGEPFLVKLISDSDAPAYDAKQFESLTKDKSSPDDAASNPFTDAGKQSDNNKWKDLNSEALANLSKWVPKLFPTAVAHNDGYRISSVMLGRNLEEDPSITPQGIKDFGVHDVGDPRQGKRTPIDLVMEWDDKDFNTAVAWLREQFGIAPDDDDEDTQVDGAGRPIIRVYADSLSKPATRAQELLGDQGVEFFGRSSRLVRYHLKEVSASHKRTTQVAQLEDVDAVYMRDMLSKKICWQKWDARSKKWVSIKPPPEIAPTILARKGEWLFPTIAGVISTPTMRPDGSCC